MMCQTSISRPRPFIMLGLLLMVMCSFSVNSAKSQTEGNGYQPKDSVLRKADSLWTLKLYEEAVPVYEKATWGENERELASGDLLFVRGKDSEMEKAISASTGEYTHVALVERDKNGYVWVFEADRQEGVRQIEFYEWVKEYANQYDVFRLAQPFDTADVISRAKRLLWKPYDDAFLSDNNKFYCSEFIYECFWKDGEHLFETRPMNWRDADGNIPDYWIEHFQKLGVPVPEGVPGTNPTDMSRSPLLGKIDLQ